MINVTLWNEHGKVGAYPEGMNAVLAEAFVGEDFNVVKANIDQPEQGLPDEILNNTDVLIWWGHSKHKLVKDELVDRILARVNEGMGAIFLHSSHESKPFTRIVGTNGSLRWRSTPYGKEILWTVEPSHPIATGIPQGYKIGKDEMYGEHFNIPTPETLVFVGWFSGGEIFRSGWTYLYGKGRVFYFQPGHETFPIYADKVIQKIIHNAALWVTNNESKLINNFTGREKSVMKMPAKWKKTNPQD